MAGLPKYDVTAHEQTLIDRIPEAVSTGDVSHIIRTLAEIYQDPENHKYQSAMMIIEKYLFRAYELQYFVDGSGAEFAYDEFFFDEEVHKAVVTAAKSRFDADEAHLEYEKGSAMVSLHMAETAGLFFRKAAMQGDIKGAYEYGVTLSRGEGVEADELEGAFWYWTAACGGHSNAMVNLAIGYRSGTGVCADSMSMIYWYLKSAAAGNRTGLMASGSCLSQGLGIPGIKEVGDYILLQAMKNLSEEEEAGLNDLLLQLCGTLEPYIYNR